MPYEHLNRAGRRWLVVHSRQEAQKRPARMTEIPFERWPPARRNDDCAPKTVWESKGFLAQLYISPAQDGSTSVRLSVCRVTLKTDGRWDEAIAWDELMEVKRQCGFAEVYAIEIYPRDRDIVNVANMRHLWLLERPLPIGWVNGTP